MNTLPSEMMDALHETIMGYMHQNKYLVAALQDIEAYARTKHTQRDGPKFDVIRNKARAALAKVAQDQPSTKGE